METFRARTTAKHDGRMGVVALVVLGLLVIPGLLATRSVPLAVLGVLLTGLPLHVVASAVSRLLLHPPAVILQVPAAPGGTVPMKVRFAWPVGEVSRVACGLQMTDGSRVQGSSVDAPVLGVDDREVELELDLPEVPGDGTWRWRAEITPWIGVPGGSDVPVLAQVLVVEGLPLG